MISLTFILSEVYDAAIFCRSTCIPEAKVVIHLMYPSGCRHWRRQLGALDGGHQINY